MDAGMCKYALALSKLFATGRRPAGVRGNDDANWYPDGAQLLGLGKVAAKSSSSSFKVSYYSPENREEGIWLQQRNGNVLAKQGWQSI